jgi:hypothetical protein
MIVRHQRTEMNEIVLVDCDVVETGNAGDVDQGIDSLADAAFEFEN